jgi:hypothetical protein
MNTQKTLATSLIHKTLYKKQRWAPTGSVTGRTFFLEAATTQIDNVLVTINYKNSAIYVNGRKQRLSKELSKDLSTIVKLKIIKTVKWPCTILSI